MGTGPVRKNRPVTLKIIKPGMHRRKVIARICLERYLKVHPEGTSIEHRFEQIPTK
ncbi:MAG: hypothetical protein AAF492_20700 [Verrucomicrobiota bacterium]